MTPRKKDYKKSRKGREDYRLRYKECPICNFKPKKLSSRLEKKIEKKFLELSGAENRITKKEEIVSYLDKLHKKGYDIMIYTEILSNCD